MASPHTPTHWVYFTSVVIYTSTFLLPTDMLHSGRPEEDESSPSGAGWPETDDKTELQRRSLSQDPTPESEQQFNLSASNRALAEKWTTIICGSDQLCRESQEPRGEHCDFNCHPCRCDAMCHFYGDCCPDLLFGDSSDIPSVPSPSVSCSREYWTKWGNMSDILMVSSCPRDTEPQTAEKCERPVNEDQDQATPVSVVSTQVTYRNIFCAQCHNESDVHAWQHRVSCSATTEDMNTVKTKAELWRLIVRNSKCAIQTLPPPGVTPRQCFHEDFTGCSENVNETIRHLCKSFTNPVTVQLPGNNSTTYRNVFCAACNGVILEPGKLCPNKTMARLPEGAALPAPLSVLLNFNLQYDEKRDIFPGNTHQTSCGKKSFYDPFSVSLVDQQS